MESIMETKLGVPIAQALYLRVVESERALGTNRDPVDVIETAIHYWLDSIDWKAGDLVPESISPRSRGYTWKHKDANLFLPDGTEIRMRFKGQYHYAKVVDDAIQYEGKPITPGSLANTVGGMNRNAWRDLWIKRPADENWRQADQCRKENQDFINSF
jgi:hypothetical protein